jgi:cyclic pyranopterin phosphate synthase
MLDLYHRQINYIRVSITDKCNLRCIYCKPSRNFHQIERSQILSYEEILRLIQIAVTCGITKVRLTGGEPLVRRDVINLVRSISRLDGVKDISLTTNGILLNQMAQGLYEAGLHRINVSLDSLNGEKYRNISGLDRLAQVLQGIEKAKAVGFSPIKINMVVIRGINDDEVLDFARLSLSCPFHIRFIEFMPIGNNQLWQERQYFSCGEMEKIITAYRPIIPSTSPGGPHHSLPEGGPLPEEGPARLYEFEGAPGKIGFISPISNHFCSTCNRIRLTADGKLRSCLFSNQEIDIKEAMRSGGSDEALRQIFIKGIENKPVGLDRSQFSSLKCNRFMNSIGG